MQPDIYAVKKDGVVIGLYAAENTAKDKAKAIGGRVFPYCIIEK